MRRYLDNAVIFDLSFCVLIGIGMCFLKPFFKDHINIPSIETISKLGESIVRICASIIGFLLTVTTVIVTFKRGFIDKDVKPEAKDVVSVSSEMPLVTIFDKKTTKEKQFYGTDLHKKVATVFLHATFEIGFVLFMLLTLQMGIFKFSFFIISFLTASSLILLSLSVIRSFYIFQLFLKVHLADKKT